MTPKQLRAVFADNVRELAHERGLTLTAVADFAGISRAQLFVLMQGKRGGSFATLASVAAVLKVDPWELLRPRTSTPAKKLSRRARPRG